MPTVHRNLTGADLHESKGVDTALSGQVYVANGAGSGAWTDASAVITQSAFTTGDLKSTWKTVADAGWILANDGNIGDGSSGGTTRANADTQALFILLWTNFSNSLAAVSGGRGASAAADFAAHKTISLPKVLGRVQGIAGTGASLTARTHGDATGSETVTLVTGNLPPYTPSGSITNGAITFNGTISATVGGAINRMAVGDSGTAGSSTAILQPQQAASTFTGTAQGGTSTPAQIMQPTYWVNVMVKL